MLIDIIRLREDIKDNYGTAAFNGYPTAMIDLFDLDRMSDQEVLDLAIKNKIYIEKYIIQE